jgi:hypothetical protein
LKLEIELPDELYARARVMARALGVSVADGFAAAAADRVSAWARFEAVLAKVPDVEPAEEDRL